MTHCGDSSLGALPSIQAPFFLRKRGCVPVDLIRSSRPGPFLTCPLALRPIRRKGPPDRVSSPTLPAPAHSPFYLLRTTWQKPPGRDSSPTLPAPGFYLFILLRTVRRKNRRTGTPRPLLLLWYASQNRYCNVALIDVFYIYWRLIHRLRRKNGDIYLPSR